MATEAIIFQQIVDVNWDQAIYTASPNGTINVAQFAAKGSGTNIGIALTPKGTGYISAQVPTNSVAGGFVRGVGAVDFQTSRTDQFHVANGSRSVVLGGSNNGANGDNSIAGGRGSYAGAARSIAMGEAAAAIPQDSVAIGTNAYASARASLATGSKSESHLRTMRAHGANIFGESGATQEIQIICAGKTTNATPLVLTIEGGGLPVVRAATIWNVFVTVTGSKSDGSAVARYQRQVTIKRVSTTTSLVGSVISIGTDEASGTSLAITADDANEALAIEVTGIAAETWRWAANVYGLEMTIGA